MRDPNRISVFCDRLATIWKEECPDWRFGQFIFNVFDGIGNEAFYLEDDKMINKIQKYFNKEEK